MLTVKIQYGDETERIFYVNDILDVKRVQDNILEDFQRVLAQDKTEDRIQLERVIEASPCEDAEELIDWLGKVADFCEGDPDRIEYFAEMKDCLDSSDYDNINDMTEALDRMSSALSDIYYTARDFN